MIDWLVVSAFEPELAAFGLPLGAATVGRAHVFFAAVGVGPIAAAAGTAALLARHDVARVAFVGTAGVFATAAAQYPIGTAAVAGSTALVDASVVRGLAERPNVQVDAFVLDARSAAAPARVATTTAITVDETLASVLAGAGFDLEHLELAGVAAACARAGKPLSAALGISNVVGPDGRREWREHHVHASAAAVAHVRAWLDA